LIFNLKNGTGAIVEAKQITVFEDNKSHKTSDGFLGQSSILLDSYFFQQFSYEVESKITRNNYDDAVDNFLHPSGFVRFSLMNIPFYENLIFLYNSNFDIEVYTIADVEIIETGEGIEIELYVYTPVDVDIETGQDFESFLQTTDSLDVDIETGQDSEIEEITEEE
jgi:hypothetical protein